MWHNVAPAGVGLHEQASNAFSCCGKEHLVVSIKKKPDKWSGTDYGGE